MPAKIRDNRLRFYRERSHLTLQEVATLVKKDFTTVSKHESMDRGLTKADIIAYAKVYKVESHELFIDPKEFEG